MTGTYIHINDLCKALEGYGRIYAVTDDADMHATMGMVIGDLRRLAETAIEVKDARLGLPGDFGKVMRHREHGLGLVLSPQPHLYPDPKNRAEVMETAAEPVLCVAFATSTNEGTTEFFHHVPESELSEVAF